MSTTLNVSFINKSPHQSHKRQPSIGLGIVTHAVDFTPQEESVIFSKNNQFFDTTTSQVRPPPSIQSNSRKDIKTSYSLSNKNEPTPHATPTFADRIRAIVLANRKTAAATPLSSRPPATLQRRMSNSSTSDDGSTTPPTTLFPEEEIVPLPSPAQPSLARTNTFTRHNILTPTLATPPQLPPSTPSLALQDNDIEAIQQDKVILDDACMSSPPPTSAIPLVSLSPTFSTSQTNVIPSLQEEPMLGDMEETGILREYKYPSPHPHGLHEDVRILGKHIWKFRIKKLLGEGAFSRVFLAENLEEGGHVAVKVINKERMYQDLRVKSSIEREVGVLKCLNHERIVQLEATMETEQHLCIVLEYVKGGELFDFVKHIHNNLHQVLVPSSIDEILIKRLALEIIQVVSWLHQINIVHRDLKLENILVYFDEKTGEPHIKITDFGLARVMDPIKPILTTRCGSEEYAAPEIVQSLGYDGRLTDTWSIGIIIYALLVGYLPFTYDPHKGEKISHLFHRIVMAQVKWPVDDNISLEAKEVVQKILVRHPDKRVRLDQVEQLPWFDPV